jgi:hypothetical protein
VNPENFSWLPRFESMKYRGDRFREQDGLATSYNSKDDHPARLKRVGAAVSRAFGRIFAVDAPVTAAVWKHVAVRIPMVKSRNYRTGAKRLHSREPNVQIIFENAALLRAVASLLFCNTRTPSSA